MTSDCTIRFNNNPDGIYLAGEDLSGIAELSVSETINLIKGN